jgi:hypothetical protein
MPAPPEGDRCSLRAQEDLPLAVEVVAVERGTLAMQARNAYEATLTLFPAPEPAAVLERYSAAASQQQQSQPSLSEQPSVQVSLPTSPQSAVVLVPEAGGFKTHLPPSVPAVGELVSLDLILMVAMA